MQRSAEHCMYSLSITLVVRETTNLSISIRDMIRDTTLLPQTPLLTATPTAVNDGKRG